MTTPRTIFGLPVTGEAETPADLVSEMQLACWRQHLLQQVCQEHGLDLDDRFVANHHAVIRRRPRYTTAIQIGRSVRYLPTEE